jgi:5'-nucleotidase
MQVLLTNDDGIDAPGIAALEDACRGWACRMIVVAPKDPHSGCGHRVTTDRPLVLEQVGPDRYHVDGTPADCVRLALATLAPEAALVVAGINAGGNLGVDVHHSGTVAAAREAALHGRRAVAASQYHRRGSVIDWERAARWLDDVFDRLPLDATGPGEFWNVNLPDLPAAVADPAVVECALDASPFTLAYRETEGGWHYDCRYHERPRAAGGDVDVCFSGSIAVTRLRA